MRIGLRLGIALACFGGAAWTCGVLLRPRKVSTMTFEQCLELVRQGHAKPIVALELGDHLREGLAALRRCGPDGELILQQLAKELAR